MTTGNLSNSGAPADGAATRNPASAHGGLWKVGIAAAIVAASALVFVSGCGKRNSRSSRSSGGDSSSEQDRRKEGGSAGVHGKVQLWEDGPYWAETNIGAEKPWEYGYYFWWGDTVGYKWDGDTWVASDGSSRNFSFDTEITPTHWKRIVELKIQGWITNGRGVLAPVHDAAHVHWGGDWRMPTALELKDLVEKCDWEWTTKNGVNGYIVRGKGKYVSASIFLPCVGLGHGTSLYDADSLGYYWSSVPNSGNDYGAWRLYFDSSRRSADGRYNRDHGQSVRAVQGFTK